MDGKRIFGAVKQAPGFLMFVIRRFDGDGASGMAASLSYTSLLSLVPLIAIALAMLAAFPVFDSVRNQLLAWVFTNFVPAVGEVVQTQVTNFIAQAGKLTAAGIVGLVFTAVTLLITIETAMNTVFRVAKPRSALARVLVYWTLMTLGPLLIGTSLSLQGYLTAISDLAISSSVSAQLAAPLPTLLSSAAFTVLFAMVPNRQIRGIDAFAGGVVAGLLFALLRWGFAVYITSSGAYTNIYGAVAAVPIFLFWMFLSWAVVLVGAEVAAALPEWRAGYGRMIGTTPGDHRLTLAMTILAELHRASLSGCGRVTLHQLHTASGASEGELTGMLRSLARHSFTATTTEHGHVLARDLGAVTLYDLLLALELLPTLDEAMTAAGWRSRTEDCLAANRRKAEEVLNVPLADLLAPRAIG